MKKVSIMLLAALAVLFAFTACPAETKLEPATQEEIDNLAAYLAYFGHDRVLIDLNAVVSESDEAPATLKLKGNEATETSVVLTLEAKDYDYDGNADNVAQFPRLATGEYTLTFTGTTEKGTFTASSYKFDSANGITLEMDTAAVADLKKFDDVKVVLTGVTGDFVKDAATEPAEKLGLKLTVANGKVTAVNDAKNGAEFGLPTAGTIAIGEHVVGLSDLKTAVKEFKEAAESATN